MPDPRDTPAASPPCTREELVAMVAKAHQDSAYGESTLAGRTLAAQSRLPKLIAENLGAGFGQWDFFPEPADIVDFACAYVPPSNEEELWALARTWAADDAGRRKTILALVGREILQHELRRIEVPRLRALFDETRPSRALALRESLGLAVPARPRDGAAPARSTAAAAPPRAAKPAPEKRPIPTRMPKPEFVRPAAPPPAAAPRRYHHPKFGEGTLVSEDGVGMDAKLTIAFEGGTKTLLARYVNEVTSA